jgi:hypothetical protein
MKNPILITLAILSLVCSGLLYAAPSIKRGCSPKVPSQGIGIEEQAPQFEKAPESPKAEDSTPPLMENEPQAPQMKDGPEIPPPAPESAKSGRRQILQRHPFRQNAQRPFERCRPGGGSQRILSPTVMGVCYFSEVEYICVTGTYCPMTY